MKNLFKFFTLLLLVILSSCEADKEVVENSSSTGIVARKFSLQSSEGKSLIKLNRAVKQLKEVDLGQDVSARIVYDPATGLFFDDENGLYITHDSKTSYTFPVVKSDPDAKVENICFSEKEDGNFDVYLVQYEFTKGQYQMLTREQLEQSDSKFIEIIKDGVVSNTARVYCVEVLALVSYQPAPTHQGELTGSFGNQGGGEAWVTIASACIYTQDHITGAGGTTPPAAGQHNNGSGGAGGPDTTVTPTPTPIPPNEPSIITGTVIDDSDSFENSSVVEMYQSFVYSLTPESFAILNANPQLTNYLLANNCSSQSVEEVTNIIQAVQQYQVEFGVNPETQEVVDDFLDSIFDDSVNPDTIDALPLDVPPSCESFNFTQVGTANWQRAAVKNIHFNIVLLSPNGVFVSHAISYPNPILFGGPKTLTVGNTPISPGLAATLSARALSRAMKETVNEFGNKPVNEMIVESFFEKRLKHHMDFSYPGSKVQIHPQDYPTPTQYQTNLFGTGDCQ